MFNASGGYSVILSNGVSLFFDAMQGADQTNDENRIFIDINGTKGPNIRGKDHHIIYININSDPVKPEMWDQGEGSIVLHCPPDLSKGAGHTGDSCGVRILRGDYAEDY